MLLLAFEKHSSTTRKNAYNVQVVCEAKVSDPTCLKMVLVSVFWILSSSKLDGRQANPSSPGLTPLVETNSGEMSGWIHRFLAKGIKFCREPLQLGRSIQHNSITGATKLSEVCGVLIEYITSTCNEKKNKRNHLYIRLQNDSIWGFTSNAIEKCIYLSPTDDNRN